MAATNMLTASPVTPATVTMRAGRPRSSPTVRPTRSVNVGATMATITSDAVAMLRIASRPVAKNPNAGNRSAHGIPRLAATTRRGSSPRYT